VLATGLVGAVPFFVLLGYSLKWFAGFSKVRLAFSSGFALRAITVIAAVLSSTSTETDLANKVGPVLIVYLFYLLSLDHQAAFARARSVEAQ
jgi:hypothetical protein